MTHFHLFLAAFACGVIVLAAYTRQYLRCELLVASGRIIAPRPDMLFRTREGGAFLRFVRERAYQTSADPAVIREFRRLRLLQDALVAIFAGYFAGFLALQLAGA